MCNFCRKFIFSWASEISEGGWVVYHEEWSIPLCLDPFIPGTVDPCCYGFLILDPCGHIALMITY